MTEKLPAVGEIFAMNLTERLRQSGAVTGSELKAAMPSAGELLRRSGAMTGAQLKDVMSAAIEQAQRDTVEDCLSVKLTGQHEVTFSFPADLLKLGRV